MNTLTLRRRHARALRTLRRVLGAGVLLVAAAQAPAQAPQRGERLALVVGNASYADNPLRNPVNDARAMAELLGRAGFKVDLKLDTTRGDLQQAIGRFAQGARSGGTELAVFYYAGHGFQQDWRNYLVPVDARVRDGADVARQTVEIGELIRGLNAAKGRSFLVILDACRDDPFADRYRPGAKGLVPFDAPVGSVLAYATAPGKVALDGNEGGNGLYTRHLLRELAVRDAPIEDVFKRVRLNVRLESRGRQVPWEIASLEERVFLFPQARATLTEAELQQRFDEELSAWERARRSNTVPALTEFIRAYPSGNTSELAQARLNRLLADEVRKAELVAAAPRPDDRAAQRMADELRAQGQTATSSPPPGAKAPARPRPAPLPAPEPAIAAAPPVKPDAPLPVAAAPAALPPPVAVASLQPTPFFSGQVEHWRDYRVGQRLQFRVIDNFTRLDRPLDLRVTALDAAADRVEYNGGEYLSDLMGNTTTNPRGAMSTPRQFYPAEFVIGKRWRTEFRQARPSGVTYTFRYDVRVAAKERVTVPAGTFDTWRIEAEGWNVNLGASIKRTLWVAPGVPGDVAAETLVRLRNGVVEQNDRQELVAVHQP